MSVITSAVARWNICPLSCVPAGTIERFLEDYFMILTQFNLVNKDLVVLNCFFDASFMTWGHVVQI